ncbi:MAG: twin-arginine translocase subunit TatC [Methylovulum sp.]|uniref:twin-arginine translocase subunit TatC n=1 Tax=Methylovulum sp. TaxID=1916980 RepID=UPI002614D28C|nr:twin-arginine translocase subunit TatC [Methylovulum sp.]MDD2723501.1 twin-arginine translocase subunit TatC [Methylovulum sp.]MDD5124543.1 twin-arginine translocase subunit TatC [Methylovulum sp.]
MNNGDFEESVGQSFISHLVELRDRLLKVILCVLLIFIGLAYYANEIYSILAGPLLQHLPKNSTMIAIEVASPFFTPFKLAFIAAIFISVPVILYQFWAFVAPGLYKHEQRLVFPLLIASTLLFYTGVAFAYFVVFPLIFRFLTAAAPVGVTVMTDISQYLDFVLAIFFAFGVCFEIPIFTIVLVWTGFISSDDLAEKRPYVIVGVFVVAMFLTPPDALSQTLLAIPMWMLFEIGLLCSRLFVHKTEEDDDNLPVRLDAVHKHEE